MPLGECQTVDRETSKLLKDFAQTVMDSVGDEAKFVRLLPSEDQLMNLMTCEGENSLARKLVKQLPKLKNRAQMNAVKFASAAPLPKDAPRPHTSRAIPSRDSLDYS